MSPKRFVCVLTLILLVGIPGRGNAEPFDAFPDISGLERIVWNCDGGATAVVMYMKVNEWWRSVIITDIKIFAVESRANGTVRYFTALHGDTKLYEVPAEQYKSDLAFASPNYAKRLRGEPSDCVRL